jgi:hypothetical protein
MKFNLGSRWQAFQHEIEREYAAWPQEHQGAFCNSLAAWLKAKQIRGHDGQSSAA